MPGFDVSAMYTGREAACNSLAIDREGLPVYFKYLVLERKRRFGYHGQSHTSRALNATEDTFGEVCRLNLTGKGYRPFYRRLEKGYAVEASPSSWSL